MKSLYTVNFVNGENYQWRGTAIKTDAELVIYASPKRISIPLDNILFWIEETA